MEFLENLWDNLEDWWDDTVFEVKAFFYRIGDKLSKPAVNVDSKTPQECWDIWKTRQNNHATGPKTDRLLLRKAADAGIPEALAQLSYQLYSGKGDEQKNVEEAEKYAKIGALAGNVDCMIQLGTIHKDKGNGKEALRWFNQAAREGHVHAMFLTAQMLEKGIAGVERNTEEAIQWYRKVSKLPGNTFAEDSIRALRRMNVSAYEEGEYMNMALNAEVDGRKTADNLYRYGMFWPELPAPDRLASLLFAAEKDNTDACLKLSEIFVSDKAKLYGIYSENQAKKYKDKAIGLLEILAGLDDAGAIYQLYNLFKDSEPQKAEKYMLQGVDAGIPDLQFKLGEMYWNQGRFDDAMKLFETAGEAGFLPAANRLRDIYYKGDGPIKRNVDRMNYWTIKGLEISRNRWKPVHP